jgi:hypothetical protein
MRREGSGEDRDWDVMLLTRFLDVLIEIGQARTA